MVLYERFEKQATFIKIINCYVHLTGCHRWIMQ